MSTATVAARVAVRGRVQGVFFRASAREMAESLGVGGWVRNLPDGGVELHLEGTPDQVREMIAWCRRGPPAATVREVETQWVPPAGERGFRITY